ncbi:MAG: hypothetical protein LBP67_08775 [Bacteroidales bacterium]|nr:hypothetical protein [Bacteroidales bacterium]
MKKIILILIPCISIFFFACNRDLKNSEAFIGDYTGEATATGEYTAVDPSTGESIVNDINETADLNFSVKLGEVDNEIVFYNLINNNTELSAEVDGKDFIIKPTKIIMNMLFYIINLDVSGSGTLVDDNLSFSIEMSGSGYGLLEESSTIQYTSTITGTAIKN